MIHDLNVSDDLCWFEVSIILYTIGEVVIVVEYVRTNKMYDIKISPYSNIIYFKFITGANLISRLFLVLFFQGPIQKKPRPFSVM